MSSFPRTFPCRGRSEAEILDSVTRSLLSVLWLFFTYFNLVTLAMCYHTVALLIQLMLKYEMLKLLS